MLVLEEHLVQNNCPVAFHLNLRHALGPCHTNYSHTNFHSSLEWMKQHIFSISSVHQLPLYLKKSHSSHSSI